MFDKYLICENSLRNVVENGQITGFEVEVRITSYRGLRLSMVEGFDVTVDGESFPREANTFIVAGRPFTFKEMETEYEARWEMGDPAVLRVPKPGGLAPGPHHIRVVEYLRISYSPVISEAADAKMLEVAT
jgi:hypothetical protein